MTWSFVLSLALVLGTEFLQSQSPAYKPESPKQVVEKYFRFEADGGRLTPEGWQKRSAFWVRDSQRPPGNEITVIYRNFSVWDAVMKDSKVAEVRVEFLPQGNIDSRLRFILSILQGGRHIPVGSYGQALGGRTAWRVSEGRDGSGTMVN